ncbi:MAG: hypothetical protein IPG06_00160 [Haliea sp.]|nr:hypothetical protein [Haliea sp.]
MPQLPWLIPESHHMTLSTILLSMIILILIGAIASWPRRPNQSHVYRYQECVSKKEKGMMNIMEHDTHGATIRFEQHELLLVMALVQEGRESFGCNTESGKAVDQLFSLANILVEEARRRDLKRPGTRQKIHLVAAPAPAAVKSASNA